MGDAQMLLEIEAETLINRWRIERWVLLIITITFAAMFIFGNPFSFQCDEVSLARRFATESGTMLCIFGAYTLANWRGPKSIKLLQEFVNRSRANTTDNT